MISNRRQQISIWIAVTWALLALAASALAQTAPDATGAGPLAVRDAEYQLHLGRDTQIMTERDTELWGQVYHPADLTQGPYPIVVFLHGNHATCGRGSNPRIDDNCQYTTTGTCPAGYVVVPNHLGYAYLANKLASWGYLVVSINANRGITCGAAVPGDGGLNLARGRLVLKTLSILSWWNYVGDAPASLGLGPDGLMGTMDFSQVGLMGHSRGGEGVRAALRQYRDTGSHWPTTILGGANFTSIFEIGAVDGQTGLGQTINADGVVWNQLLPLCDGDVADLQGVRPFDRMMSSFSEAPPAQKSTYTVWGANHNFYNTEWQQSDAPTSSCVGPGHMPLFPSTIGSPSQRTTGEASLLAFFRANVFTVIAGGWDTTFNQNFNPQYTLPAVVTDITRVDRGFTDSPNSGVTMRFEDFTGATGTSTYGFPNDASNITINHGTVPRHSSVLRAGQITWTSSGSDRYFQTNWTAAGDGRDISAFATLDLRVSRQNSGLNPTGPTNFSIALVHADGSISGSAPLNGYTDLRGPGGGRIGFHPILQTARIPLADFTGADLNLVRGVRLTFNDTGTGAIYVANIRLSRLSGSGSTFVPNLADYRAPEQPGDLGDEPSLNIINSIRTVVSSEILNNESAIEIELISTREFPVRDELIILRIGGQEFELSRYPDDGHLQALIFTLTPQQFARLGNGERVMVQYGRGEGYDRRDFGLLDRSILER